MRVPAPVQIRAACTDIKPDYAPPMTFIVVQKRHHTRIFPLDQNTDRSGNVLPGARAALAVPWRRGPCLCRVPRPVCHRRSVC